MKGTSAAPLATMPSALRSDPEAHGPGPFPRSETESRIAPGQHQQVEPRRGERESRRLGVTGQHRQEHDHRQLDEAHARPAAGTAGRWSAGATGPVRRPCPGAIGRTRSRVPRACTPRRPRDHHGGSPRADERGRRCRGPPSAASGPRSAPRRTSAAESARAKSAGTAGRSACRPTAPFPRSCPGSRAGCAQRVPARERAGAADRRCGPRRPRRCESAPRFQPARCSAREPPRTGCDSARAGCHRRRR